MNQDIFAQSSFTRAVFAVCAVGLLLAGSCSTGGSVSEREANLADPRLQLIKRLEDVDYCSRMNANSFFRSSADSELSVYFAEHADEVERVLRQLESGREVPATDVQSALDTSYAKRVGGYPC